MHRSLETHLTHAIRQDAAYTLINSLADLAFAAARVIQVGFSALFRQLSERNAEQQRTS